jgi:hypothetical protein
MSKWMAVAALGAMMAVVGCDNNKDDASDPMKMSASPKSSSCTECSSAKKEAEPKKLSAAPAAKADCQTQCPADAAKAK